MELDDLDVDGSRSMPAVSSSGPPPCGLFQELADVVEVGRIGQVGSAEVVECIVSEVAEGECIEFIGLVVDGSQFQDVFEIEAVGAFEVIAEGGDTDSIESIGRGCRH